MDADASDSWTTYGSERVMWFVLVPVFAWFGLTSHDDLTKFWIDHPRSGCHWLYRERGVTSLGGFAWPLKQTNAVLCWQASEFAEAPDGR